MAHSPIDSPVPALSLSLAACGDTSQNAPAETAAAPETVTEQITTTETAASDDDDQDDQADDQPQAAQSDLPAEVTGYTGEAEAEMAEEGVSTGDVESVLAAANNHETGVEIEWDDDGYWEIEYGDIDIDIDPSGLVREVDRDD